MKVGIIGGGAIGTYVRQKLAGHGILPWVILSRRCDKSRLEPDGWRLIDKVDDLPGDTDLMVDCAGHSALGEYGPEILRRGTDLVTISVGALADEKLYTDLERAAIDGRSKLHLASGAIGALDCLRAAKVGGLEEVLYTARKPPMGWRGSPAEEKLDLQGITSATIHFEGTARQAATRYPKNANVAAAVALAGCGFDQTAARLIADPSISSNIHEIQAKGTFGSLAFKIEGHALPDNPRSSALAAMSVIASIERKLASITF